MGALWKLTERRHQIPKTLMALGIGVFATSEEWVTGTISIASSAADSGCLQWAGPLAVIPSTQMPSAFMIPSQNC